MKNETPAHLFRLLVLAVALFMLCSCHSTRKVVDAATTGQHSTYNDSIEVDCGFTTENDRSSSRDTTNVSTDVRGSVEIKRDSTGRPVFIYWAYSGLLSTLTNRDMESGHWFSGINATRHASSAASVDYVNEKTEEATQDVDTRIHLEDIIASGLFALLLIYLIYLLFSDIVWPWIKQKRSR